jgi:hypothetical protein
MATYSLEELASRWVRGDVDAVQMLGQLVQHMFRLERELRQVKDLLLQCAETLKQQGH